MKRINDSTWSSIKCGMTATIIMAIILGASLIQQEGSLEFVNFYFKKAMPISLTVGTLTFCLVEIFKHIRRDTGASGEEKE